ncbi:MAG: F0F1 ATP synthase subunit delta [Luteolibacter sp.]
MKISKVAAQTARRLFGLCLTDGKLDEAKLGKVISTLVESKPRDYRSVLVALQRLVRLDAERRQVTVESAVELDAAARERVAKGLTAQYGSDLVFNYQITPSLLGGLRIRVGSDVFDGSVQGRINRLANAF